MPWALYNWSINRIIIYSWPSIREKKMNNIVDGSSTWVWSYNIYVYKPTMYATFKINSWFFCKTYKHCLKFQIESFLWLSVHYSIFLYFIRDFMSIIRLSLEKSWERHLQLDQPQWAKEKLDSFLLGNFKESVSQHKTKILSSCPFPQCKGPWCSGPMLLTCLEHSSFDYH